MQVMIAARRWRRAVLLMNLYSIWPYLALVAGVLLLVRLDRPFRAIDAGMTRSGERFASIDGLRGLLAFGVFGHHAALMHDYLETGIWRPPPSVFYTMIGEAGVAFFFSITGFLFWGKLLHERGAPEWKRLYAGRFFRIAPVYLAVVAVMLLVVWNETNFELREPLPAVLLDTARWLALGILGQPDVNGYQDTGRLLAGVTWTLNYEWLYYFSLPLLALFARGIWHLWFALSGLFVCGALHALYQQPQAFYAALFFSGMIPASLMHRGWRVRADSKPALLAALASLVLLFTQFSTAVGILQLFLIGIAFGVIGTGNDFLGTLVAKPVRRLGELSYSVYLIHGLVLMTVFSVDMVRDFALENHARYWLIISFCGVLVVTVSALSYLFIERPGIRLGKYMVARFGEHSLPGAGQSWRAGATRQ